MVAFDCDGVLFDTLEANRHYYNHILRHFGRPPMNSEQLRFVHAHTVQEALALLLDDDAQRQAHVFRKTIDYGGFLKHLTIEPHLVALLDWMRGKFKTAIATNRTDTMNRLLREFGLADRFDLVVTSLDVERPKPFRTRCSRSSHNSRPHRASRCLSGIRKWTKPRRGPPRSLSSPTATRRCGPSTTSTA